MLSLLLGPWGSTFPAAGFQKKGKKIKAWPPRHHPVGGPGPAAPHTLLGSTWGPSSSSALWLGYRSCTRRMRMSRSAGRMELALRLQAREGKVSWEDEWLPQGGWWGRAHLE